jgi:short-subunit dehydrogenase
MNKTDVLAATGLACLVTGATSGIGEAVTTQLAARGARVLAVARTAERADAALVRMRRRVPGGQIEMLVADVLVRRRRPVRDRPRATRVRLGIEALALTG